MLRPGEVRALLPPAVEGLLAEEPGEARVVRMALEDVAVAVVAVKLVNWLNWLPLAMATVMPPALAPVVARVMLSNFTP